MSNPDSLINRLNRALEALLPTAPGPELLKHFNEMRAAQVSLDHKMHRVQRALTDSSELVDKLKVDENLYKSSALLDELKAALEQRIDATRALQQAHADFSASGEQEARAVEGRVQELQMAIVRGRAKREGLIAIVALTAGLLIGIYGLSGEQPAHAGSESPAEAQVQVQPATAEPQAVTSGNRLPPPEVQASRPQAISPPAPPTDLRKPRFRPDDPPAPPAVHQVESQPATEPLPEPALESGPLTREVKPTLAETFPPASPSPKAPESTSLVEIEVDPPQTETIVFAGPVRLVNTASLRVRSQPSTESSIRLLLYKGARVEVIGEDGRWSEIRTEEGRSGWVYASFLDDPEQVPSNAE